MKLSNAHKVYVYKIQVITEMHSEFLLDSSNVVVNTFYIAAKNVVTAMKEALRGNPESRVVATRKMYRVHMIAGDIMMAADEEQTR